MENFPDLCDSLLAVSAVDGMKLEKAVAALLCKAMPKYLNGYVVFLLRQENQHSNPHGAENL